MNTISTLIPRQNCPNNPVHFMHNMKSDYIPTYTLEDGHKYGS